MESKPITQFKDILHHMQVVFDNKNHDYSGGFSDPYANFKMCETFDIPAWKGVLVRLTDKMSRLQSLARTGIEPKNEAMEDTMLDIANYAVIMLDLYMQEQGKPKEGGQ